MLDLSAAVALVSRNCAADVDPTLTNVEITALVEATAHGVPWAATTAYPWGTIVLPTARNGHAYRVSSAGTTGATEPGWPISSFSSVSSGTVVLGEAGADWPERYDIRRATYEAYQLKLAKAANYVAVGGDGQTVDLRQIVANLTALARGWVPVELP